MQQGPPDPSRPGHGTPVEPVSGGDDVRGYERLVVVMAVVAAILVLGAVARSVWTPTTGGQGATSTGAPASPVGLDPSAFVDPAAPPAPALELTDPEGQPFSLASQRGHPVLVFFGYTHCPDVCPTTIGTVGEVLREVGWGTTAVFASIDPERDTPAFLKDWVDFLPEGFQAVTGTPEAIRATAADWGVQYARIDTEGGADAYSMAHTADVYLVDAEGRLRATFPYGTEAEPIMATVRRVADEGAGAAAGASDAPTGGPPASSSIGPSPTPAPAGSTPGPTAAALGVEVRSTSVWAGGESPVILALEGPVGPLADTALPVTIQVRDAGGSPVGAPVKAEPVQPPGVDEVAYVATLDLPAAGAWRLDVATTIDGMEARGWAPVVALDPADTAPLGEAAPTIRTPTLDDVGGDPTAVTTDPAPDLRLSRRSTSDALAEGEPFVLVLDSNRFRVSPACGRAIVMVRYLLDRWRDVDFIHHEPYRYSVISQEPVLEGSLSDPSLTEVARAWGIEAAPWGPKSMPWIFIVDGDGVVRAKYQGVVGTEDVDVMLSLLAQEG
jgi:protein SCO1/2